MSIRAASVAMAALACAACASREVVQFTPKAQQQAIVRDGSPALISRKSSSLVLVRPAAREFQSNARPVFTVGIFDLAPGPIEFRVAGIEAIQVVNRQQMRLKVFTYEELTQEERNRQIASAVLVGLAAGANAAAASRAGYYNSNATVTTSNGVYNLHTSGYSPTANAIAQANASAQNEAMISATVERGQANMAALEATVLKDNTLFPGEWYGGRLYLQPPASSDGPKTYQIVLNVGPDRHEIDLTQVSVR